MEQREKSVQVKPSKGTAAGSVGRGLFLRIIRVCHLLSSVSGHIYPIAAHSIIHSIDLNVREFIGGDKLK